MANWFEVRAGTMTEAEARAYFGRPTLSEAIQPGETGAMRLRLSCLIRWPSPAAFKTPSRAGDKPHVPSEPRSLIGSAWGGSTRIRSTARLREKSGVSRWPSVPRCEHHSNLRSQLIPNLGKLFPSHDGHLNNRQHNRYARVLA
jgi:hypothetical protein